MCVTICTKWVSATLWGQNWRCQRCHRRSVNRRDISVDNLGSMKPDQLKHPQPLAGPGSTTVTRSTSTMATATTATNTGDGITETTSMKNHRDGMSDNRDGMPDVSTVKYGTDGKTANAGKIAGQETLTNMNWETIRVKVGGSDGSDVSQTVALETYNCKGFMQSSKYMLSCLRNCDVMCLSETWFGRKDLCLIDTVIQQDPVLSTHQWRVFGKSGMCSVDSDNCGRPFGGVAVICN